MLCSPSNATTEPPPAPVLVSMLTYNVEGLPWPVATGRPRALARIASGLAALRRDGRQPHLVMLQEAFVPEAKAIGRTAGYRYVAFGPGAADPAGPMTADDRAFAQDGDYLAGEREGKRADSGLAIFSDYPILASRRMVYPVCAGFDCLANKGALAVSVAVPGVASPIVVIDTHLNSRAASGVSVARSLYAYQRQIDAFDRFVADEARSGAPVLIAGDFNVGRSSSRRSYFSGHILGDATAVGVPGGDVARRVDDVASSLARGKDWLMFRSSPGVAIAPVGLSAPIGRDADGAMLSDHLALAVTYRLSSAERTAAAVRIASR